MPESILPEHVNCLIEVSSPELSSDGTSAVFAHTEIDREAMVSRSRLVAQRLPDGQPVFFTQGDRDGRPRFSPDGQTVAFLRPDDKKRRQVWLIATGGGEARRLTDLVGGVRDFAWSPDGQFLAVVSKVDPDAAEDDAKGPHTWVARRIRYRNDEGGWCGDAFSHVFVVRTDTGASRQVTDGEGDNASPVWSPDGTRIAFVTDGVPNRDFDRRSEAHVVSASGGDAACWSRDLSRVDSVAWSPDGAHLAAIGSHDAEVWDSRMSWLYVLGSDESARQISSGEYTIVGPLAERCWVDDHVLTVADRAGESFLCRVPVKGGDLTPLLGGGQVMTSLTLGGQYAVGLVGSPGSPGDLALFDLAQNAQTPLTAYNRTFFEAHPPARLEKFAFSRAGSDIQARVFFPADFDASKPYPLVLDIHGGPNGRFADSFDITHQALTGAGYLVLAVNPRGSSSYGPDFMKAVLRDWGGEDFRDLMAGVDALCERPYVDADRLGVHGYSYGGYMSSWIVGHDHRFKAAVVGAPCINLHSMYGTSDIGVSFGENQWGGSSIQNVEALADRSPLTYAAEVRTPVLLMHGETDYRCPIEQSEQFFVALKRQGKTVEFVRFPDSAHGFRRSGHPKFREEYLVRMVDWFNRFLGHEGERR